MDGYTFAPSEQGDIHMVEIDELVGLPSVTMEESHPAKAVLARLEIEDFVGKSPMGGTGEIGMPVEHLDRFLDGADRSAYSVTVAEDVKAYIEGDA